MPDQATPKQAQDMSEYSASDANKQNQKQNAAPPAKTPAEGKDPMSGPSDKDQGSDNPGGDHDTPI